MKPNPPIKAVMLDIGNVLLQIDWAHSLKLIGLQEKERFLDIGNASFFHDYECGLISSDVFKNKLESELGLKLSTNQFREVWCACLNKEIEGVSELLIQVSKKVPLYTLSNTNELHYEYFKTFPLFRPFKKLLVSHHMKLRKPDQRIYEKALEEIQVSPHEVLFVDDLNENLNAAAQLKINTAQCFRSSSRLLEIFRKYELL